MDGDPGQQPVAIGDLRGVRVDIDDDQVRSPAGDTDPPGRRTGPPGVYAGGVGRGGMETVARTACGQTGAVGRQVILLPALRAVPRRRLAARCEGMHRPALLRTPPRHGVRCDRPRRACGHSRHAGAGHAPVLLRGSRPFGA